MKYEIWKYIYIYNLLMSQQYQLSINLYYPLKLVGGILTRTPLKNMSSSVGSMTFSTEWKVIKFHGSKPPTSIYIYMYIYIHTHYHYIYYHPLN